MADLIPENLATRSDLPDGLQAVGRAFRDRLPDDVIVWLEEGASPYLTVLDPARGILVVECSAGRTLPALREIELEQVRQRAEAISGELARTRFVPDLPVIATAALPRLSRSLAGESGAQDPDRLLLREDFDGDLMAALSRVLARPPGPPLSETAHKAARAAVRPQIVIAAAAPDTEGILFNTEELAVLDLQQERLAHTLGAGYRVIRGVAGCGKTLVLVHRARWLAEHFPHQKILLACYNVALRTALAADLSGAQPVTVATVDSLAWRVLTTHGIPIPKDPQTQQTDFDQVRERAVELARQDRSLARFHHVLVDEAQDLDPLGLELCWLLAREEQPNFVVALDGAQNVYRKHARWNPPGLTARGRTTILRKAYRNTREIAEFAWRFLQQTPRVGLLAADDEDDPTAVVPPEMTLRRGPVPRVELCATRNDEITQIADRMIALHAEGTPWRDMVILFGSQSRKQKNNCQYLFYQEAARRSIPYFWVTMSQTTKKHFLTQGDVVLGSTFQGLKGLEFKKIFICGVNDIWDGDEGDLGTQFRLAYVAMTRAIEELMITVSGSGPIGEAILAAQHAPD